MNKIDTKILCNYHFDKELSSLENYEGFHLLKDRFYINEIFPINKLKRFIDCLFIIGSSLFSSNFIIYLKSLNFIKYGAEAINLTLFYKVNFLIKNEIEIIHAHFGTNGNKAVIFKELGLSVKLYTTFHGYDIRLGIQKGGGIYSKLFKYGDGIISISKYNKQNLLSFGAPQSKIIDLPNGIDTTFFKRKIDVALVGKIRLISVARLVPEKGLKFFLIALKRILDRSPNLIIEYNIIGDGPLLYELQEYIDMNKLGKYIFLLGSKNTQEVRNYLINSDIYILSSVAEAFPTVLLEAQSCALPILATNVGSVIEMIPKGVVVEPNSIEALVDGFYDIINKRGSWIDIGLNQRNYVKNEYNINVITKELIKHYYK